MASISIKNLASAIYESSLGKEGLELDSMLGKSVIFLRDKNLLGKKKEILEELENIINKNNGIIKAKISSSEKLKDEGQKEIEDFIKKKYKANEVIIEQEVDPKLLGGIKIEIGDDIIDTTLSSKIHQLKNYLIKN
jgi:F-type H+-transporting ATPase subunit delta